MDLGKYLKKDEAESENVYSRPKKCLQCGKEVSREKAGHLYFQSFCSKECKEQYVGRSLD